MGVWVCGGRKGCGTGYRVRLSRCPRCHNTEFREEGSMPKISRHAGATVAGVAAVEAPAAAPVTPVLPDEEAAVLWHCLDCTTAYAVGLPACPQCGSTRYADQPAAEPEPVQPVPDEEGGEEPSPGSSSGTSPEKPPTNYAPSKPALRSRARKTASRSPKGRTDSSSARSMDGGQTADTSAPDTTEEN